MRLRIRSMCLRVLIRLIRDLLPVRVIKVKYKLTSITLRLIYIMYMGSVIQYRLAHNSSTLILNQQFRNKQPNN